MQTTKKLLLGLLLMGGISSSPASFAQQLAFPGAQGWGRFATGGRTGSVYHVTNLNDSGTGSLRDAVSQPNRIVVFDVAGVINIKSRIVFAKNLYVAGQSAPGEGVTVYGDGVSFSGSDNIIVRYMRFRMGHNGSSGKDCAGIANGQRMIFDHCSFAWGLDETFSINPDGKGTTPQNITLQNCVVGQGLMTHSAGGLIQTDYVSLIGNFLCDNSTRNFKVKGINQYANNIVYNWQNGAYIMGGDSEGKSYVNIQSNLFINGPAKGGAAFTGANADFHCYGVDNWQDNNLDGVFNPFEITDYNAATREQQPYDYPELTLNAGKTLLETNLPTVGASLPYRDMTDCYMVDEVLSYGKSGALISNEASLVYGAPSTWTVYKGQQKKDSDGDGMPDAWEEANGTDPAKNDAMTISANGYANIENYLNGITVDDRDYFLRTPVALSVDKTSTSTITLSWRDYTYAEEGFAIELRQNDGTFVEVGRTGANATTFTITSLQHATKYCVRIRAFAGENTSDYTAETYVSTRPVETGVIDVDSFEPDYTWTSGEFSKEQAEGKNVLLAPNDDAELSLAESAAPAAIVFKEPVNLTLGGAAISGNGSVNHGGTGVLSLTAANTYTGATVVHDGVLELATLKDGGETSSMGASVEFAQNWIMDGGTCRYTGGNTSTNRSMKLTRTSVFDIKKGTVSMSGTIEGAATTDDFILDGSGQLTVASTKFFGYKGATVLRGSKLNLSTVEIVKTGIGSSSKLVLAGGHLLTAGENEGYETYAFPIEVSEGTTSQFSPHRNCYINSKVSGAGTLQLNIPYLREYVQGDWSAFSGRLIANGVNSKASEGSLLLLDKQPKLTKTAIELRGSARLCYWSTNGSQTIGGLSGVSGTYLMGSSKKDKSFNCVWTVGSANTDETFRGSINNWDCTGNDRGGTTGIVKTGTGLWRLTGTNDYRGTTTVNGGTLIVNGKHTGTGAFTVNTGATLGGKGTIAAAVTLKKGATLLVGDTLASDKGLTLNGGMKIEEGAILQLNDAMAAKTYADDASIRVFTGKASGTVFSQIIPERPSATQVWDTTQLLSTGYLFVRAAASNGIHDTKSDSASAPAYDLQGRNIQGTPRGFYIQNGKKHVQ